MSKRIIIPAAIGAVLLAAAVMYLREPDPQTVLRQATKRFLEEKTFRVEMKATIVGSLEAFDRSGVTSSATGIDIMMRASIDRSDPMLPASESEFEFTQNLATGGMSVLAGEARRKDGMHYLRLSSVEGLSGMDPERLTGRWMKSDRPFMELLLGNAADEPLDPAELESIKTSALAVDLFTVVQKLPNGIMNERKAYRYAVEMNMEAVSALLLKHRALRSGRELVSEDVLAVTAEVLQWNKPVGEIWVDAKTRKFKQITLGTALGADGKGGAAAVTLAFSGEGERVSVDAPEAEDAEDVLGPLFGKRLNLSGDRPGASVAAASATAETSAAALQGNDADGDGLADAQESFYGSDPGNPDTDADGYPDGLEVEKGMNPVGSGVLFGFGL